MFKKLMAVVLVGLLTLGSMATMSVVAAGPGESQVFNFDDQDAGVGALGWTTSLGTDTEQTTYAVVSSEQAKSGSNSLKIKSSDINATNNRVWKGFTGLTPGATYKIEAQMYVTASMYKMGILVFEGADGGAGWTSNINSTALLDSATASTWIPLEAYFTVPDGGAVTIALAVSDFNFATKGVAYFDDITLTEMGDDFEGNTSFEYFPLGSQIRPLGWNFHASLGTDTATTPYAVASTEKAKTGSYSLEMAATNLAHRVWRPVTGLTPGATYMLKGYMYLETLPGYNAGIAIYAGTNGGTASWAAGLTNDALLPNTSHVANEWIPLTAYFTAPPEGAVTIELATWGGVKTYFDDITVTAVGNDFAENAGFEYVVTSTSAKLRPAGWNFGANLGTDTATNKYAVASTAQAKTGSYSLEMKSTDLNSGYRVWKAVTGLTPGAKYMLTGYMYIEASAYRAGMIVYPGDNGGTQAWNSANVLNSEALLSSMTLNTWIPLIAYFDAPAEGAVTIELATYGGIKTYFDDVTVTAVGDDFAENSSFEYLASVGSALRPAGWNFGANLSTDPTTATNKYAVASTTQARTGSYSLEMKSTDLNAGNRAWKAVTGLTPGETYMLRGYMYVEATVYYAGMSVYAGTNGGTAGWTGGLNTDALLPQASMTANVWMPLVSYFTAPGEGAVTIELATYGGTKTYFDDVTVTEVEFGDDYQYNTGFEYVKSGSGLMALGWTYGTDLKTLSNAGNDSNLPQYAVVTDEKARTGNYSLKISTRDAYHPRAGLNRVITGLTPGKTYKITSYVNFVGNSYLGIFVGARSIANDTSSWGSALNYAGAATNSLGQEAHCSVGYSTSDKWVPCSSYFVADAESVRLTVQGCSNYSNNGSVAYIDDINITEVDSTGMDVSFIDANGNEIRSLTAGQQNDVKVFVSAINSLATAKTYKLVYATYSKEGEITAMKTVSLKPEAVDAKADGKSFAFLRDTIDVTVGAGETLKVFVFDDISTLSISSVQTLS